MTMPEEGLLADMMAWLQERLNQAGFIGYEISNYAKPGHEAKHNAAYWDGKPYLGLGPSAHSFDGKQRWYNLANNALYQKELENGRLPITNLEQLAGTDLFNERLLTGLRLAKGFDYRAAASETGVPWPESNNAQVSRFVAEGYMLLMGNNLMLTKKGRLLADFITQKLMV
jgi:oxygen-independent coproporphyrinogen-3 oxidase